MIKNTVIFNNPSKTLISLDYNFSSSLPALDLLLGNKFFATNLKHQIHQGIFL